MNSSLIRTHDAEYFPPFLLVEFRYSAGLRRRGFPDVRHDPIDIAFSNLFFDPITQTFPIDQVHFFEKLTHKWARIIPNWTAEIALIGAIVFVWPLVTPQKHPTPGQLSGADQSRSCASVCQGPSSGFSVCGICVRDLHGGDPFPQVAYQRVLPD
jgi:hypothetical protein